MVVEYYHGETKTSVYGGACCSQVKSLSVHRCAVVVSVNQSAVCFVRSAVSNCTL